MPTNRRRLRRERRTHITPLMINLYRRRVTLRGEANFRALMDLEEHRKFRETAWELSRLVREKPGNWYIFGVLDRDLKDEAPPPNPNPSDWNWPSLDDWQALIPYKRALDRAIGLLPETAD
jgi:hypothetical protein